MDNNYTKSANKALQLAERAARENGSGYIGTEHLLLGLLRNSDSVAAQVLLQNDVTEERLKDMISSLRTQNGSCAVADNDSGYTPRLERVLEDAGEIAQRFHSAQIGTEHILMAMILEGQNVALKLIEASGANIAKIYFEIIAAIGEDPAEHRNDLQGLGIGNDPDPAGSRNMLDQYSRDLTRQAQEGKLDPVIGREEEMRRMIQILSRRTKNNPCLIGEPGVGKTAIVEGLAQRIVEGNVPESIQDKRLLSLDISGMVAGSKYRGEFEERIKGVIEQVRSEGDIILFVDEMHTLIGAGGAEGAIDASNILKPALARGELQMIGATTISEYRKYVEKDSALERRFQPVMVEEPTKDQTYEILKGIVPRYEEHHGVTVTDEAMRAAVRLSERYINDRNLPDKAIDVIDEACAAVRLRKSEKKSDPAAALRDKVRETDTAVAMAVADGRLDEAKARKAELDTLSARLLHLEDTLHKRIIGQEDAVDTIARAIRRGRVGLQDPNRPIGSFLFLGPTGVGKTELSKALADAVFGDEKNLIRVDMSEYMEQYAVSKMIGSAPGYVGYEEGGQLTEKVREHPYSVVLFDEIEKAHPDVFNVLLQILDEGHLTDSKGHKVNFKNTIVIMTSNVGARNIVEPKTLGFAPKLTAQQSYDKMKNGVMEEVKKTFRPEFINRIDGIVVFHPLTKPQLVQITGLLCNDLAKRGTRQLGIDIRVTNAMKQYLVDHYADDKMGARPLKRAIQTVIEDPLSEKILAGEVKEGNTVTVGYSKDKVTFSVKQ